MMAEHELTSVSRRGIQPAQLTFCLRVGLLAEETGSEATRGARTFISEVKSHHRCFFSSVTPLTYFPTDECHATLTSGRIPKADLLVSRPKKSAGKV